MQSHYPFAIEREMGCTEGELRAWLPGASAGHTITWYAQGADIELDQGCVSIRWHALVPRRIALIVLPRLAVHFDAKGVDEAAWQRFMRHFDLYTQRGGG